MTGTLRTAAEIIQDLGLQIRPAGWKRLAKRHGIPHYRLGRHTYYDDDGVAQLLERTRTWPDAAPDPALPGDAAPMSSAGQRMASAGSVRRAQDGARMLKASSRLGLPSAADRNAIALVTH